MVSSGFNLAILSRLALNLGFFSNSTKLLQFYSPAKNSSCLADEFVIADDSLERFLSRQVESG